MEDAVFRPEYNASWAVVIGVNSYNHMAPLEFACNDAKAVSDVLLSEFGFPKENVCLLTEENASKERILETYLSFADDHVSNDDRIVFFFAGHGVTRSGRRGEVGYLVPQDGDPDNIASLIRWDEITRNSDLVAAKHMVFLMDACYGGLAILRGAAPGSSRFLKNMLQRYSRQVLTAGKADEPVADGNGPRRGHSIFTGHLLDALEGAASGPDGILSTNAVMAYVCDRVARDPHSQQSPHYGYFAGDGDLIFKGVSPGTLQEEGGRSRDLLIQTPIPDEVEDPGQSLVDSIKVLITDPSARIRLDDLVSSETRRLLAATTDEAFPSDATLDSEEFASRLRSYEEASRRLIAVMILLSRWATPDIQPQIARVVSRLAEANGLQAGNNVTLGLRWYPLTLLTYSGGIAAISERNYQSLASLLVTRVHDRRTSSPQNGAVIQIVEGMLEVQRSEKFKQLPGHERHYVPQSEYLFRVVQPHVEDLLFLGNSYEELFDRYEVLQALVFADLGRDGAWGPPGRFAWKRLSGTAPFDIVYEEAVRLGEEWPVLKAGLFSGSADRFREIADQYRESVLSNLHWY